MWKLTLLTRLSLFGILVFGITGCTSLGSLSQSNVPAGNSAIGTGEGQFMVEMPAPRGEGGRYIGKINPNPPNPTTVQSALEEAGVIQKYGNMDITVYRRIDGSHKPLKMPIKFEPGRDAVTVQQDYALHSGDRIVVEPVSGGPVSKILDTLTGQL